MRRLLALVALASLLPGVPQAADVIRLVPDKEAVAKDPVYVALDRSYRVRYPELGGPVEVRETMVNPAAGWAEFAAKETGALYIVSVRLSPEAGEGRELDAVRQRYADFPKQAPRNFVDGFTRGPFGRTYTFTLLNADPVTGYPVKLALRPGNDIDTAAVHRFFVANGYQYELAFVAQRRGAFAKDDPTALVARANAVLDRTLAGFQPLRPSAKK